jgi:linoleoyl-CoA desaturase
MMGNTLNLLGGNASLWRMQHNTLHHTFTNIDGVDEDINGRSFLRFSPHQPVKKMNRYQHIYAWGFYTLLTLNWVMVSDFFRVFRYREKGLIKNKKELRKELTQLIFWKSLYYAYAIVLPILLVPVAPWVTILGFVIMHMVAGFILSVVFQMAHVMTEAAYPVPDETNTLPNSWAIHQIETTINFAPKSKLISWLVGGLNYQIEHHLFSNISHVHYKKLSVIVEETAHEFGVAYRSHPTFARALREHTKMLRQLGHGYRAEEVAENRVAVPA